MTESCNTSALHILMQPWPLLSLTSFIPPTWSPHSACYLQLAIWPAKSSRTLVAWAFPHRLPFMSMLQFLIRQTQWQRGAQKKIWSFCFYCKKVMKSSVESHQVGFQILWLHYASEYGRYLIACQVKGHCKQILNKISAGSEVACFGFIYIVQCTTVWSR